MRAAVRMLRRAMRVGERRARAFLPTARPALVRAWTGRDGIFPARGDCAVGAAAIDSAARMRAALSAIAAYHERTQHHLHGYARALGYLDWATQPDPFRRYVGAARIPLPLQPPDGSPRYADLFGGKIAPAIVDAAAVGRLFQDSLALSAWKEHQGTRWSLRVNPSSGNLHPTEAYLLAGAVPGLTDAPTLCHY